MIYKFNRSCNISIQKKLIDSAYDIYLIHTKSKNHNSDFHLVYFIQIETGIAECYDYTSFNLETWLNTYFHNIPYYHNLTLIDNNLELINLLQNLLTL